jgi:LuxR family maltose regulon positive regulatory protein
VSRGTKSPPSRLDRSSESHEGAVAPVVPILRTKLHPPPIRPELVRRPAILGRLSERPLPRLTLVSAPPGWGKSTLLAQWAEVDAAGRDFAWLSLDHADGDPIRFWKYVLAALEPHVPEAKEIEQRLVNAPRAAFVELLLPSLVNALAALPGEVVLVLDDFHALASPDVHGAVGDLLEHAPPTFRLVIATRADPPLPLGRLRASGELEEIRVADLRFNDSEAAALLTEALEMQLTAEQVGRLQERTEGWPAGLHLAALSLRSRDDADGFIESFSGDDRHVIDYLGTEVLESQREEIREFLLQTSVLDRLCASLCDAVTGRETSDLLLEEIERKNLFLVPLDNRREWYRYHHLFGQLLRHELERGDLARVAELHRRASAWHRDRGSISEAVHHAVAAGAVDEAADLIALHWNAVLNAGGVQTVVDWLDALPPESVRGDPRLCLVRAGTLLTLGRREEVEPWLDAAEAGELRRSSRTGAASVEAEAAIYRAVARYMLGDVDRAREAAVRGDELERDDTSPWRAMARAALGRTLYWCGDVEGAAAKLADAVRLQHPTGNNLSVIAATGYLAIIRAEQGDLQEAERLAQTAVRRSHERGFGEHWVPMTAFLARASALVQSGRLDEAEAVARRAVELARRGAGRVELAHCLLGLADVLAVRGETEEARTLVGEARVLVEACAAPGALAGLLAGAERGLRVPAAGRDRDELSARELAVLRLLTSDLSLREIGAALYVSHNTVKTHARNVYRKLGAASREEAVARARELELI